LPDRKYISCSAAPSKREDALKIGINVTNEEMGKILRDPETVKELAKTFEVSTRSVRSALDGVTQSDLAKRIRKRALDMGLKEKGKERVTVLK
jgi:hypothetical protein